MYTCSAVKSGKHWPAFSQLNTSPLGEIHFVNSGYELRIMAMSVGSQISRGRTFSVRKEAKLVVEDESFNKKWHEQFWGERQLWDESNLRKSDLMKEKFALPEINNLKNDKVGISIQQS